MGVGYDNIALFLSGNASIKIIIGILIVKSLIWTLSLGSGTSGCVRAPILMIGCALGSAGAYYVPGVFGWQGPGFWALVAMTAVLAGTIHAPLTAVVFALELTHDVNLLLPLLIAAVIAHATTVLLMRRSILTEKLSRRGYHLSREYSIDPLEITFVREVMRTNVVAFPSDITLGDLKESLTPGHSRSGQWLYPLVDNKKKLINVVTRHELEKLLQE